MARQQERGQGEALLPPHEQAEVRARVTRWREQHAAVPMDASRLALLELGLASHHAGMLPLEKNPDPCPNPSPPTPSPSPTPTPGQACCRSRRRWSRASSKTTC